MLNWDDKMATSDSCDEMQEMSVIQVVNKDLTRRIGCRKREPWAKWNAQKKAYKTSLREQ